MTVCAVATSSPARAGAARPIRSATSKVKARMKLLRWLTSGLRTTRLNGFSGNMPKSPAHPHQILLRFRIAECGRLLEPLPGNGDIAGNAMAVIVDRPESVHGGGLAQRCALFEQALCLGIIARNTFAVHIEQAEIVHAGRHAGLGR